MSSQPMCELCGSFENLKICAGCGECYYCSREHQVSNWKHHKRQCKKISKPDKTPSIGDSETDKTTSELPANNQSRRPFGTTPTDETQHTSKYSEGDQGVVDSEYVGEGAAGTDHADTGISLIDTSKTTGPHGENLSVTVDGKSLPKMAPDRTDSLNIGSDSLTIGMTPVQRDKNFETLLSCDTSLAASASTVTVAATDSNYNVTKTIASDPVLNKSDDVFKLPPPVTENKGKRKMKDSASRDNSLAASPIPPSQAETKLADYVVKCLNAYGICVVDTFMGEEKGSKILKEVCDLRDREGAFQEGQTAQKDDSKGKLTPLIRGDQISWVEKGDPGLDNIAVLISRLDTLMVACSKKLGTYHINGRTKAMVACYPGAGRGYMKHVDNPNGDGRCVTCIYYINKDWDIEKHGGLLRIFPTMFKKVADIVPKFDRLLFFWSDRRNPHEVQPAYRPRLAITVWYFDAEERKRARIQYNVKASSQNFTARTSTDNQ